MLVCVCVCMREMREMHMGVERREGGGGKRDSKGQRDRVCLPFCDNNNIIMIIILTIYSFNSNCSCNHTDEPHSGEL